MAKIKEFKYIIIGNNNTALSTANLLSKNNKVALIYNNDGDFKSSNEYSGEFEYLPNKSDWQASQDWLNENFQLGLESHTIENQAKTVQSGNLANFLGFGEREGHTIADLSWYNESERLQLNKNKFDIQSHFINTSSGELIANSEITDIVINESNIDYIVINGQNKFSAEKYIFCSPPNNLINLIDASILPTKFRQKVTKQKALSTLQVLYRHKNNFEFKNEVHFLMGNKSDFEPCIGYFWKSSDNQVFSQWLTLLPSDLCEDIENVGSCIKNVKRQIKRAYPQFYDHTEFEKVFVLDQTHGHLNLDLPKFGQIKGIKNLLLGSPLLSEESDLYATIDMTKKILEHVKSELP